MLDASGQATCAALVNLVALDSCRGRNAAVTVRDNNDLSAGLEVWLHRGVNDGYIISISLATECGDIGSAGGALWLRDVVTDAGQPLGQRLPLGGCLPRAVDKKNNRFDCDHSGQRWMLRCLMLLQGVLLKASSRRWDCA